MHARWTDATPHRVVGSILSKGRYTVSSEQDESEFESYNTLPEPFHLFIDDFGVEVTKDKLNRAWARDTILLLAYYCSVYIRGETLDALDEIHGAEYMRKLTGGNHASIGVLE